MKSAAVLPLLLLATLAAAESGRRQLGEALLRSGAERVGPKVPPALRHSRGAAASDDVAIIDKLSYTLESAAQKVEGVLSNLTLSGLSSLKLRSNGKSVVVGLDLTIDGQYSVYGTSGDAVLEAQGGISFQLTDFQSEASLDYTVIDETKISMNSVDLKVSAPSIKINFEDFIIDMGAAKLLNDLLGH